MLEDVDLDWTFLVNPTKKQLDAVGQPAASDALTDLGVTAPYAFGGASKKVLAYAEDRAAEMVGKKWVSGELVDNPNAEWAITDTTRDTLKDLIKQALKDGTSTASLKAQIQDSAAFSASRAANIADTELTAAFMAANKSGWAASGLDLEKRSLLSDDHDEADECDDNANDGWIDYDTNYSSGDDGPAYHNRCHCSQVVRTKKLEDVEQPSVDNDPDDDDE